ncbi:adenosine deaminase [Dermacentor silvarum]|uniref:adenosine deaminase n=1 Tax=Dermacentor silvarum TaxID=543639 RepID=UPI00189C0BFE|nr:adenosine deaminase [Dermacentor silvarum]
MQQGTMPLQSYKVQLHSHLDTYMRHETIWELSQQKDLGLNYNTIEDVRERTKPKKCTSLDTYLTEVPNFLRTILGDRDALERVAYEAGLDQAGERVLYSEMRIPPQLLAASSTVLPLDGSPASAVSGRDVVDAALAGLRRAEREADIKLRLILTCLRGTPEWAPEVLDLCREYKDRGVVGIDVCGVVALRAEDGSAAPSPSITYGEEITHPLIVQTFERAASWGVHRTAHAGEAGPPATVLRAMRELHAERIGHGYRAVLDGGHAYRQALSAGVHFECCLTSSILTGAVDLSAQEHPVLRLRRDGASFSISVDDPAITHTRLEDEYRLALMLGLGPGDLLQCNRSAISACFLPADEKWELRQKFDKLTNAETADA